MLAFTTRRMALQSCRPFSSTALVQNKIPTLGDFTHTPESSEIFRKKVLNFREELAEKARAPKAAAAAAAAAGEPDQKGVKGVAKSLLYGSAKGQREEAEMEQSYSQVLARGKYVHAIEFHHVKPEKHVEYVKFIGEAYPAIASDQENRCHLVGSWKAEVGDLDTFVHIWEYQGYAGYHHTLNRIANSPLNQHLQEKLPPMLNSRRTDLMQEFSFWPTSPPRSFGGVFELRSYTLSPGNLLDWETHWRGGLKARRNVMEGVGAWFTQVGELNRVHYLWQFPDLRARQVAREKSWGERGWSGTVHKTVPLIQKMETRILVALPWSPVS